MLVAATDAFDYWGPLAVMKTMAGDGAVVGAANAMYGDVKDADAWLARVKTLKPAAAEKVYWARQLDQAMMRTDWSARASSVFFGCHSPVFGGHSHMDPASFDYTAAGRPMIVDPGRYTYAEGQDRRNFKSAPWHNTLTINDREPFDYINAWTVGPQKEGRIVGRYQVPGLTAFEAVNKNFDPLLHLRLLLDAGDLVIVDVVDGLKPADRAQLWYHFDTLSLSWDAAKRGAVTRDVALPNAGLGVSDGLSATILPGFVSDYIDQRRPSKQLRVESAGGPGTRAFLTHVRPFASGAAKIPLVATPQVDPNGSVAFAIGFGNLVWTAGKGLVRS